MVDLHAHTTASDGILSPTALVAKAHGRGIRALAITDHDTVEGIREAQSATAERAIEIVPGIEISATLGERKEVHILGHFVNIEDPDLLAYCSFCRVERVRRIELITAKLRDLGLSIGFDEVLAINPSGMLGRMHIAMALVEKKEVSSIKLAFEKYLYDDGPAYITKWHFPVKEAIALIHKAGGNAIIAHPGRSVNESQLFQVIEAGIDGIEVRHPSQNAHQEEHYRRIAEHYDLLMTGGSDFHGSKDIDETAFSQYGVTYEAYTVLRKAAQEH
jgi:predicted metal-dependent phosphoesterase TrpH